MNSDDKYLTKKCIVFNNDTVAKVQTYNGSSELRNIAPYQLSLNKGQYPLLVHLTCHWHTLDSPVI